MQIKVWLKALVILALTFVQTRIALAEIQQVFFGEELKDQISRIDLDGKGFTTLTSSSGTTTIHLAIDPANRKLYFMVAGLTSYELESISFDGSNETILVSGVGTAKGLALDLINNKMYWTEDSFPSMVRRADLDGGNQQTLVSFMGNGYTLGEIQVDPLGGNIYYMLYTASGVPQIRTAALDGTADTTFNGLTNIDLISLFFDKTSSYLYWSEKNAGLIKRISVTNRTIDTVFDDSSRLISGIAVDPEDGPRIYFAETSNNLISSVVAFGTTVTALTPESGEYSGPNHLALLPATTLSPGVTLIDPPEVRVSGTSRTVEFVLQAFDETTLTNPLISEDLPREKAVNLSVRYDLTVTRTTDGFKKRRITRNSKTSVKLPAGSYKASYNARTVSNRSTTSRKKELAAANKSLDKLSKIKPRTIRVKNKIEDAKARKVLSSVKTRRKTNQSPKSDSFSVG